MNTKRLSLLLTSISLSALFVIPAQDAYAQSWEKMNESGRVALASGALEKAEKSFTAAIQTARAQKNNAHLAQSTSDLGQVLYEQGHTESPPVKYVPGSILLLLVFSVFLVLRLSLTKSGLSKKWLANYAVSYLSGCFGMFLCRNLIAENILWGAGIFAVFFALSTIVTAAISGAWAEKTFQDKEARDRTISPNVKVLYYALMAGVIISSSVFALLIADARNKQKKEFQTAMFIKSEKLLNESLAIWKNVKVENAKEQAHTFENLGHVFQEWNMPEKASLNYNQSVECAKKTNNMYLIAEAVANYANFLEKEGDKKHEKELYSGLLASLEPKFKTANLKGSVKVQAKIKGKHKMNVAPVDKDLQFARQKLVSWKKKVAML